MSGIVSKNGGRASGIVGAGDVGADAVDGSNIADDAIDSEHYAAGSIDEAHIADNAVTLAKMAGGTDGQIITFDASGNPAAVGPGTDGQVLTSTGAGSPPAFEAISAGKIIQHRYDMSSANDATSSTSYVVTSLSQTITPASTSNDILVLFMSGGIYQDTTDMGWYYDMTVFKDDTNQGPATGINGHYGILSGSTVHDYGFSIGFMFLDDAPGSTSSLTYDIRHKVNNGSASINMGHRGYSYMHLFELEGGTD